MRRARAALLAPYWDFWEASVEGDLRAERAELVGRVRETVAGVDVVTTSVVDSHEAGALAGEAAAEARADLVLVAQSMAVPPAYTLAALDRLPGLPLVVVVVQLAPSVGAGFSHSDVTSGGATVGTPQLTNVLHRQGRPHALVVGVLDGEALRVGLSAELEAAGAAGLLRRARIGRVGSPVDGYDCVDVDQASLRAATGVELVAIEPEHVRAAYIAIEAERAEQIEAETRAGWELDADVEEEECFARSMRFAAALEGVDEALRLDAGAMNCHVASLRFAEEPGITPCFALGRETSRGIPWSCSGDVVTAVAMLATKLLGGAALYHEIEALDLATGEAVLANSGEHDLAWGDPASKPRLRRNQWFRSDARCGACACIAPAPGPATLVAFTPHAEEPSGYRFVVAEGELTGRSFPATGTANGAFRFAGEEPVDVAWARWVAAGPNHHSSATPGLLGGPVARVAEHLGIGCVRVS
jgi:L-arabinose isomerase